MRPQKIESVLAAIKSGPMSASEITKVKGMKLAEVNDCITFLRASLVASDEIHISDWKLRNVRKQIMDPVYSFGPGDDKEKPRPLGTADKERRQSVELDLAHQQSKNLYGAFFGRVVA